MFSKVSLGNGDTRTQDLYANNRQGVLRRSHSKLKVAQHTDFLKFFSQFLTLELSGLERKQLVKDVTLPDYELCPDWSHHVPQ